MGNGAWSVFLELLRAGLWEQDLCLPAVPDAAGWEQLMRMARSQSVMGLFLRGLAHLPDLLQSRTMLFPHQPQDLYLQPTRPARSVRWVR